MIRDYSMYTLYPILKLAKLSQFELEQCKKMFEVFDPPYSEYLGYSGYRTLEGFCRRFKGLLDLMEKKDEFIELLVSLLSYANKISAWSYHYFPWEIGVLYPQKTKEDIAEMARLAKI